MITAIKEFSPDGLVQFHWQSIDDPRKTEFVAQGKFDSWKDLGEWVNRQAVNHQDTCPVGYQAMICDSSSSHFMFAPLRKDL